MEVVLTDISTTFFELPASTLESDDNRHRYIDAHLAYTGIRLQASFGDSQADPLPHVTNREAHHVSPELLRFASQDSPSTVSIEGLEWHMVWPIPQPEMFARCPRATENGQGPPRLPNRTST